MTSCKKEGQEMQTTIQETERVTGEDLPQTEAISAEEISKMRQAKISSYTKEVEKNILKPVEITSIQANSRSRTVTNIACGDTKSGTTRGETNTIDVFSNNIGKSDKIYLLETSQRGKVRINLTHLQSDLDLFVFEVAKDNYGREYIGNELYSSYNEDRDAEYIEGELDRGKYFIIVETYRFESNFQLSVKCDNGSGGNHPYPTFCEDYQNLYTSYTTGISEQSNHWKLWDYYSRDGLVLLENYNSNNKVVKLDNSRFGYQSTVRELTGVTLTRGYYTMKFDLYIPSTNRANFSTEKTRFFGQEQGFDITIENGRLSIEHKGSTYTANNRVPTNRWISVQMAFDIVNDKITVIINNDIQITMNASANKSYCYGRKSIQGINFFTNSYNSKFHIDNVCVTEIEPGVTYPFTISSITESIDLQCP
jgi:hypothetical protein